VVLTLHPNGLLGAFGLPTTTELWIRVLGVVVTALGAYYSAAAKSDAAPFFRATIIGRTFVLVAFTVFVLLGLVKPVLILFGAIDFACGMWTLMALRSQAPAAR
jgi:hypothetical protein